MRACAGNNTAGRRRKILSIRPAACRIGIFVLEDFFYGRFHAAVGEIVQDGKVQVAFHFMADLGHVAGVNFFSSMVRLADDRGR